MKGCQCHLSLVSPGVDVLAQWLRVWIISGMAPLPPSSFFDPLGRPTPRHVENLCIYVKRTGTCVVCLPHVLRDIPDESRPSSIAWS